MLDHPGASLAGVRRHDLPRAAGHRDPSAAPDPAAGDLASAIDRQLAAARRAQLPLAVLAVGLNRCMSLDGRPQPLWLEALALELGQRLRARVRRTDSVLWHGGREHVVVLHNCRHDMALLVQQRLLGGIRGTYRLGPQPVVAEVAIGCACHPAAGDTGAQLLDAALRSRGPLAVDGTA